MLVSDDDDRKRIEILAPCSDDWRVSRDLNTTLEVSGKTGRDHERLNRWLEGKRIKWQIPNQS